jgi:hypothetical protein
VKRKTAGKGENVESGGYLAGHNADLLSAIVIAHGMKFSGSIENLETFVRLMENVTRDYQHPILSHAWRFGPIVSTLLQAVAEVCPVEASTPRAQDKKAVSSNPQNNQPSAPLPPPAEIFARLASLLSRRLKYSTPPLPPDMLHPASCPLCLQSIPPVTHILVRS